MADINVIKWNKVVPDMTKGDIIKFQIMVHCHLNKIRVSSADLECLSLLGQHGNIELTPFCQELTQRTIFLSVQSGKNAIGRLQDKKIIVKNGTHKKFICINPEIQVQSKGNVLVDIKCFSRDGAN